MHRLFFVVLVVSAALAAQVRAHAELIEITALNRSNILKITGSLNLACYAPGHGHSGLYGRSVWRVESDDSFREYFENKGLPWIKAQVKSFERSAARTRAQLRLAERRNRTSAVQKYRNQLKELRNKARQANVAAGRACLTFFANAGDPATPPPAPTPTPTPDDGDAEREALENPFGDNALDPIGLARLEPGPPTVRVFVDSADGNDANNGLTEEAPVRSIERAYTYLAATSSAGRTGGWILLKRGAVYTSFPTLLLSGWSQDYPFIIGAYGEFEDPRPIITAPIAITAPLSNLVFTDIHFDDPTPGSGTGLRVLAPLNRLLVQNSLFTGFRAGISVEGLSDEPAGRASDISLHRNIFRNIGAASGASYGLRVINTDGVIISNNVFAEIGRDDSRGLAPTEQSIAASIGSGISNYTAVRGNQFLGGGVGLELYGAQSGEVRSNLFARVGIAANIDVFAALIAENAVIEGRDIGALNRGWGIKVSNARAIQMHNNVVANTLSALSPSDYALKIDGQADMGFHMVEYNDIFNWGYGLHVGNEYWNQYAPLKLEYKDTVIQNLRADHASAALVTLEGRAPYLGKTEFRRLRLHNPSTAQQKFFRIIEHTSISRVQQRYTGWFWNRRCYATDIYVSPNPRKQSAGWYDGFALVQGASSNPIQHFYPSSRFRLAPCVHTYSRGAAAVSNRVALPKFHDYISEAESAVGAVAYQDPERSLSGFLAVNSLPGSTFDDFVAFAAAQDRGNFDFRTVGGRPAYWIRVGFNRP